MPAWYVFTGITSLTFSNLSLTISPEYKLVITFIFPYSLFLLYYYAEINGNTKIDPNRKKRVFLGFLFGTSILIILHILFSFQLRLGETPVSHLQNYKYLFEISVLLVEIILGVHCYIYERKKLLMLILPAMIYGIILENAGISLGFFLEEGYLLYLPFMKAPLVTILGWPSTLYISVFMVEKITKNILFFKYAGTYIQAFLTTIAAILIDFQLDPFATKTGLWKWNPELYQNRSILIFGVPLLNFSAWFGSIFSFTLFFYTVKNRFHEKSGGKKAFILIAFIPVILALETVITFSILLLSEGLNSPGLNILRSIF